MFAIGAVAGDKSNRFYLFADHSPTDTKTENGKNPVLPAYQATNSHTDTHAHTHLNKHTSNVLAPAPNAFFISMIDEMLLSSIISSLFPRSPFGRDCILEGVRVCVWVLCVMRCENSFTVIGDRNTTVSALQRRQSVSFRQKMF